MPPPRRPLRPEHPAIPADPPAPAAAPPPSHPSGAGIPDGRAAFVDRFADVVEDSRWVAEEAWEERPFADVAALHGAFERVLLGADEDRRRAVLRAHPELAVEGGVAPGALSPASADEQAGAGLDRLAAGDRDALAAELRRYRERHGFPFVACVRDHGGAGLRELLAARIDADPDAELRTATAEVSAIARHRLEDLCA